MEGGSTFSSTDPATGREVWSGPCATEREVDEALRLARRAAEGWADRTLEERIPYLRTFAALVREKGEGLAEVISLETGKPLWESLEEVAAVGAKVDLSIEAYRERRNPVSLQVGDATGAVDYRPLGVLGVLGPFNMPGHIPNGHLVPAILSGNAVIFKPSKFTPRAAETYISLWEEAGIPPGVLTLIQGSRSAVSTLVNHPDMDGILFTGSYETGRAIHRALGGRPEKMLALEMGGNNPLVVFETRDVGAAVYLTILSAYLTAGQRCTCARRLIVGKGGEGDQFMNRLAEAVQGIRGGHYTESPEPFHGPVISEEAGERLLALQERLSGMGARDIVLMRSHGPRRAMLSPGILDVTGIPERGDTEWFGPLLQVIRVKDFDEAVEEARRTSYGLAAGLLSDNPVLWEKFKKGARCGHMVWNRQTTGASGRLPFGGLGTSGNHRPSGYYAADYCSDPVASLVKDTLTLPSRVTPGLEKIR